MGPTVTTGPDPGQVCLYWIPLGAGGHSVRFNGIVYEAIAARVHRRPRYAIYHAALSITREDGTYWVEMTPVPDGFAGRAVAARALLTPCGSA